jgi:PAS domain S-box-containing protein
MGLLTLDGWIMAANAAVCEMFGYTEAELKQRNDRQNIYPEDVDVGADLLAEMLAGKRGYFSVEKRYVRKNGNVFWTRLTLSLVHGEEGQPAYLIGMVEDIDEIRRKSAALAESEARFQTMFNTAAVGVGIMGLDRKVVEINPALCQMFGFTRAELIGQTSALVVFPQDFPRAQQQLQDLFDGKYDSFFDERRYVRKNGEVFWAHITMSLVRDNSGKPLHIVGIVIDIDERKKAQESLRETEARFKAMYDNTAVGMAMMSVDRKIISVNQACARMTGYTPEELVDADPTSLSHPEDVGIGIPQFQDMVAGRIPGFQMEKRFIRKDGTCFWARVTYSVVPSADGSPEYLVGMVEDITEPKINAGRLAAQEAEYRRALEERIAERTVELNLANERLSEKAAQDAVLAERTRLARDLHDAVTQTLFSTTLIADVLPDLWEMDMAEGKKRLQELRLLTRGALAEMRTLLVELRPNALVEVPLPTLLRQLVDALAVRARTNILLSVEGSLKIPADVQVGMYRIAQEALNNVVKHAKASEAVMTLRLGETVRLTIADNGKGFDPTTVTADHMGLKIMRERAEAIGARFSIYSEPDEGTQVSVVWKGKLETV